MELMVEVAFPIDGRQDASQHRVALPDVFLQAPHKVTGEGLDDFPSALSLLINLGQRAPGDAFENTNAPALLGFATKLGRPQNGGVGGHLGVFVCAQPGAAVG